MKGSQKPHTLWFRIVNIATAVLVSFSATASGETEKALGHAQAPVTLIEYGSMTCDYCIHFHREVLPIIQSRHIDSGQVRFIFRDFPTSAAAARGAVAARCATDDYYNILKILFLEVGQWSQAEDVDAALVQLAKQLDLDTKKFNTCLKDPNKSHAVTKAQQEAREKFDIIGTPTFFINGKVVKGKKSIEEMEALIKQALSQPDSAPKAVNQ